MNLMIVAPRIIDYSIRRKGYNYVISNPILACESKSNSKELLVSIITIVKNNQEMIHQTISSVINQNYKNVEYIIIDGGSTDQTLNLIKSNQEKIAYCVSENDEGISDAFNKGISLASGDIIGLINSDDWYEDEVLNKVVKEFTMNDIDIIHGELKRWKVNGEVEISESNENLLHIDSTVNHPTVFARRELYEEIGLFRKDYKYAMDYEWLLRAKKFTNAKFLYINSPLANMRLSGISSQQWKRANKEVLRAKNIYGWNINNYLYFYYKILKGSLATNLSNSKLNWLVTFYRKKFSIVKKELYTNSNR